MNTIFTPAQIIEKKKKGKVLTKDEISYFITAYMEGSIADYQMTAMLMAIYFQGMNNSETAHLTNAMLNSGRILKFSDPRVIDKHSTGGIGDKTSFILAPIAAACGVKVPMIAGRGLSFTAGTVDKFEAINGINTQLSLDDFCRQLEKFGIVLIGQTNEIAPADKRIYALRDVTSTVDSIPLITASIMSKKLAEGANGFVFDIKCGKGAFMQTTTQAKKLAKGLANTAYSFKRSSFVYITDMNRPLGKAVGHSLELIECFETLKNKGPKDLTDLSVELAAAMIFLAGITKDLASARKSALKALTSGAALEKFRELIKLQGGNPSVVDDYSLLPMAPCKTPVLAPKSGFVYETDPKFIGLALVELGGGRKLTSDKIDFGTGMIFHKTLGDKVSKNDTLLEIYHHPKQLPLVQQLSDEFLKIIKISKSKKSVPPLIYDKQKKIWKNRP